MPGNFRVICSFFLLEYNDFLDSKKRVSMIKTRYCLFFFILAFLIFLPLTGQAFHNGGAAPCEGCHTMHNYLDGSSTSQSQAGAYLLRASDQSSVCLNCHQKAGSTVPNSFYISTADSDMPAGVPPAQLSPGGDFGWLKKNYSWVDETGPRTSRGERHGHNIIATDYGYMQDSTLLNAPGGVSFQYPSDRMSCISCHEPHGKYRRSNDGTITTTGKPVMGSGSYDTSTNPDEVISVGSYRLLGGVDYQPKSLAGNYAFIYQPFFAVAPENYNRSESALDVRVAYGQGVSRWCGNCHANMHTAAGLYDHPADQALSDATISIYNQYRKTGDLTGTDADSYLSLVPFQLGDTTNMYTLKSAVSSTAGPVSGDKVICLTCHRAHASGWDSTLRFPNSTFTTVADEAGNAVYPDRVTHPDYAMGRTRQEFQRALYDRPATKFAAFQRSLCNKCHAQDSGYLN
jgi:hypothetical protein